MTPRLDHIVLGCARLDQGADALQGRLGVTLPEGGQHPAMSTHNRLTRLGSEAYFELIAVDPAAPDPGRVRWFSLDDPATQARLAARPRALCWVVAVDDLDAVVARSPVDLGEVLSLARGDLTWRLTVPRDGHLPEAGLLPAFIEWPGGQGPASRLPDQGLHLTAIHLRHPAPEAFGQTLEALGLLPLVRLHAGPRALSFDIECPAGPVTLD
ncbi:VOC family protein [Fluviibacterium sp. S390]|uniref:VOC family protein n=1 Tax=Fluviibacterium sp. S390 TaxID=3415139 RepID=UPI003C7B2192